MDRVLAAFQGMIFDVYQWPQKLYDGSEHRFEMLKRADTVSVICVVDDKILVLDDEQPHLGRRENFPGGRIDPEDESPLAAAKREVREETGYSFNDWRLIKVHQPYRKIEWFVHVFVAWDVESEQEPVPDPGEKITVERHGFAELKDMVLGHGRPAQPAQSYLAESADIFGPAGNLDDLLALPEFTGQEVDR